MYEFDEERWDEQDAELGDLKGTAEGWLIQSVEAAESRISASTAQFLQIGTGQWCSADYATLFPLQSAAIVYAKEFGYVVGRTVRIVKHRF